LFGEYATLGGYLMSETMRMLMEVIFNLTYLIVVWGIVIAMYSRRDNVRPEDRRVAKLVFWAFILLALGDTGHVGFRVVAYALGDLNATISLLGFDVGLVGLGALATAITVTFFYLIMLKVWHERFKKPYGWFGYLLMVAAFIRLILMIFPENQWNNLVPPQPWGVIRNFPLTLLGLGLAYLILRDALEIKDCAFSWIGISILVSYAMYIPDILFVQQIPLIGMLMIPKTMAYVAIAFITYFDLYHSQERASIRFVTGD
jgi:hypothetical protein